MPERGQQHHQKHRQKAKPQEREDPLDEEGVARGDASAVLRCQHCDCSRPVTEGPGACVRSALPGPGNTQLIARRPWRGLPEITIITVRCSTTPCHARCGLRARCDSTNTCQGSIIVGSNLSGSDSLLAGHDAQKQQQSGARDGAAAPGRGPERRLPHGACACLAAVGAGRAAGALRLNGMQFAVLKHLGEGSARTAADLCRFMQYDTGAMTRILDRLRAQGTGAPRALPRGPPCGGPAGGAERARADAAPGSGGRTRAGSAPGGF